ncbi:hypothetical protein [Candidatus Methanomassiliicoccus intestinalis]|uniref:hypothetical protein n=1 Tax=Candidatus Methanomassiliicoccus intestinalis TaxID=1406512 RepID=UPI0037DD3BB1
MNFISMLAALIGFAPPVALMFISLRNYTYPKVEKPYFSDPTFFGMFAVGIFVGVALYAVSIFIPAYFFLAFVIEELVKLVILNLRRFQLKADTPFYAFGLGAGMAAAIAFGTMNAAIAGMSTSNIEFASLAIMLMITIQTALLTISTSVTIGIGAARGRMWSYFAQAVVIHLAVFLLGYKLTTGGFDIVGYALYALSIVFVVAYYYYLFNKIFPAYIKEALRHLAKQTARKERRERKEQKS